MREDIVTRLRVWGNVIRSTWTNAPDEQTTTADEAADEIERLRNMYGIYKSGVTGVDLLCKEATDDLMKTVNELRDKNIETEKDRDFWRDLAVLWMRKHIDTFVSVSPSSPDFEEDDSTIVDRLIALNHPDAADAADIIESLRAENDDLRRRL